MRCAGVTFRGHRWHRWQREPRTGRTILGYFLLSQRNKAGTPIALAGSNSVVGSFNRARYARAVSSCQMAWGM